MTVSNEELDAQIKEHFRGSFGQEFGKTKKARLLMTAAVTLTLGASVLTIGSPLAMGLIAASASGLMLQGLGAMLVSFIPMSIYGRLSRKFEERKIAEGLQDGTLAERYKDEVIRRKVAALEVESKNLSAEAAELNAKAEELKTRANSLKEDFGLATAPQAIAVAQPVSVTAAPASPLARG